MPGSQSIFSMRADVIRATKAGSKPRRPLGSEDVFARIVFPARAPLARLQVRATRKGKYLVERHTPLVIMVADQVGRSRPGTARRFRFVAAAAALVTLIVHLIANPHYGFFRDELYFVICGFRPAWGYVDQPPLVPLGGGVATLRTLALLLRAVPAFFAAAGVYATCLLVVELGGGAFAESFAALVATVTPVLMHFGTIVTTDIVGLWLWPLAALYTLRLAKGADPRWWLAVGAIVGISLESKYSVILFFAALIAALLVTPQRRALVTPWFAGGVLVAAFLALPNFLWQAAHAYPMLTLLRDADEYKNVRLAPLQYVATQFLIVHPLLAPVSLVGLVSLLRSRVARFLGIAYVALIALMILLHGKDYYPGNVYPILIAAAAVTFEGWTATSRSWRPALAIYTLAAGVLLVPLLMPVLPERTMSAYDRVVVAMLADEVNLAKMEQTQIGNLPPDWADMHGWRELAALVARVYYSLPPGQRAQAAILASNYGEASAIDFFGASTGFRACSRPTTNIGFGEPAAIRETSSSTCTENAIATPTYSALIAWSRDFPTRGEGRLRMASRFRSAKGSRRRLRAFGRSYESTIKTLRRRRHAPSSSAGRSLATATDGRDRPAASAASAKRCRVRAVGR